MVKTKRTVTRKKTINTPTSIVIRFITFDFKNVPNLFIMVKFIV